jgi:hypothetical protein
MGILIGPTPWWQQNVIAVSPVGTTLPDGSRIICKAGGTAWIVAPDLLKSVKPGIILQHYLWVINLVYVTGPPYVPNDFLWF